MIRLLIVLLLLCPTVHAQTTIKISALPEDTSISGSDYAITLDTGVMATKKALWSNVIAGLITNSASIASLVSNETGTGFLVFSNSPVFTTPNIGTATGSITGNAGTATALAANPQNCQSGYAPSGVNASGVVEDCFDVATQNELDAVGSTSSGWSDGGTSVFAITTSDNVGIGSTTASGKLEIVRTAGSPALMVSSSASGDGNLLIVGSSGNVGIGTVIPGMALDIATASGTATANALRVLFTGASSVTNDARIQIGSNDGAAIAVGEKLGSLVFVANDGTGAIVEGAAVFAKAESTWSATNRGSGFSFDTVAPGATARTERMRFSGAGLLGIGTTAPNSSISVIKNSTNPYFRLSSASSQTGDIMVVDSAGNVGLGTLVPLNKLHVNSDVRLGSGSFTQTSGNIDLYVQGNVQAAQFHGDGSQLTGISAGTGGGWTDAGTVMAQTTTTDLVGIGTTTPSATVEIVKQSGNVPLMVSATATGDGDYLLLTSTGNVGIGTLLPSNKLEVQGAVAGTSLVGIGTTEGEFRLNEKKVNGANYVAFRAPGTISSNVTWTLPSADASGCFQSDGSGTVTLATCGSGSSAAGWTDGGTNVYTTTTTDTVGIGTTTASGTLEIVQQGSAIPFMVSSVATGDGNRLIVTSGGNVGIGTVTAANQLTVNGGIQSLSTGNSVFASGNVGVGTSFPVVKLQVSSSDTTVYSASAIATANISAHNTSTTVNNMAQTNYVMNTSAGTAISGARVVGIFKDHTSGSENAHLAITTINDGTRGEVARFQDDGNVGIGTVNPQRKLQVSGTAMATDLYVSGNVGIGTTVPVYALHVNGQAKIDQTDSIGWAGVAGANTACNTTCVSGCVFGQDTATMAMVACTDATADLCLCAGPN